MNVVAILGAIFYARRTHRFPGFTLYIVFFVWSTIITVYNTLTFNYAAILPEGTTSYGVYVLLRFANLASCGSIIWMTWLVYRTGQHFLLIKSLTIWAAIISVISFYIYVAQLYGLPEPSRTRIGTGGDEQIVEFSFAFHRAMGTFREPGIMASWLLFPMFISISNWRSYKFESILIPTAMLLTCSVSGVISSLAGIFGSIFILSLRGRMPVRWLARLIFIIAIGCGIVIAGAHSTSGESSIIEAMGERILPLIFGGGIRESNREMLYRYINATEVPIIGWGLGNANILYSQYFGCSPIASFLSLYYNVLYSCGVVGLSLFTLFLLAPILLAFTSDLSKRSHVDISYVQGALGSYIAILVDSAVANEQLTVMFCLSYASACFISKESLSA